MDGHIFYGPQCCVDDSDDSVNSVLPLLCVDECYVHSLWLIQKCLCAPFESNNNDNNTVAIVLFKNIVITELSTIAAIYTLLSFYNVDWAGVIHCEIIIVVTVVVITTILSVVIRYCWL